MQKCVLDLIPGDIIHWDKEFNRKSCPNSYDIVLSIRTDNLCYINVWYQDTASTKSTHYIFDYEFQINRFVDII